MKYLYCEKCKEYPKEIVEYGDYTMKRVWDDKEDEYIGEDNEFEVIGYQCGGCYSELKEDIGILNERNIVVDQSGKKHLVI